MTTPRLTAEQYRRLAGVAAQPTIRVANGRPVRGAVGGRATQWPTSQTLTLPFLTPGVNHLYSTVKIGSQIRRVPNAKYQKVLEAARKIASLTLRPMNPEGLFGLHITVSTSLYTKAGKVRRFDASNRIKSTEDVVSKAIGVDDSRFWVVVVTKADAAHDSTEAVVWALDAVREVLPQVGGAGSR